jgi:hypothetical protein
MQRDDGLLEIRATLIDVKGVSFPTQSGLLPAGEPLHHVSIALLIDDTLTIRQVDARLLKGPGADCMQVNAGYSMLEGMTLGPGFNRQVRERFGGVKGCTHMTELLPVIATVATQCVLTDSMVAGGAALATLIPQLEDGCFTWRRDGPNIRAMRERATRETAVTQPAPGVEIESAQN